MSGSLPEERLGKLFLRTFDEEPERIETFRADGSNRGIYRLHASDGSSVIGVHGPDAAENRAFISFSREFRRAGLPVPTILGVDEENHIYLEEDLGDTTLFSALSNERRGGEIPDGIADSYRKVIQALPDFQVIGGSVIDFSLCWPRSEFDRRAMMWDLHYFKYLFLRLTGMPIDEERLEDDFERLIDFLLEEPIEHFLYRDFQSRNVMLRPDETGELQPWFIDYQGGRRGALQYDVASLLYDAKADLPEEFRSELLALYLDRLEEHIPVDRERFLHLFPGFILIRALQAMGAYGYRGLYEGKKHFIESIPYGIANIITILNQSLPIHLPELAETFEWLQEWSRKEFEPSQQERLSTPSSTPLRVVINSFSYKQGGYPSDSSDHGGGFIFDCRSIHNPGRFEEYRELTGKDNAVIEFLNGRDDVEGLWEHIRGIVEGAITRYMARDFDYLSVGFGCTGGRHRSVYFAERLANHLTSTFPGVRVELQHREQSVFNSPHSL